MMGIEQSDLWAAMGVRLVCESQVCIIPGLRLSAAVNGRDKWGAIKRDKSTKRVVDMALRSLLRRDQLALPVKVYMTRIAPRPLDSDNLGGALKATQDTIADWLGVDDGRAEREGLVEWVREQAKGPPGHYALRIELNPVAWAGTETEFAKAAARAATKPKPDARLPGRWRAP